MSDAEDYAAFQAWKAQQPAVEEPTKKTLTEQLKDWMEGVARHLSHPIPEELSTSMDDQIEQEKNASQPVEAPEVPADVEEIPAVEVDAKLPVQ